MTRNTNEVSETSDLRSLRSPHLHQLFGFHCVPQGYIGISYQTTEIHDQNLKAKSTSLPSWKLHYFPVLQNKTPECFLANKERNAWAVMSNWTYFCLLAINICRTHDLSDISMRTVHVSFSVRRLASWRAPAITSQQEGHLSPPETLPAFNGWCLLFSCDVQLSLSLGKPGTSLCCRKTGILWAARGVIAMRRR